MNPELLKESLRKLHEVLPDTDNVDDELRGLLKEVDHDVHDLLGKSRRAALVRRLEERAANFSAEHPKVEKMLREVADTLTKMGV